MSTNSYSNIFIHVVFSTKERRGFLIPAIKNELILYISGIAKNNKFQIPIMNGTDNHLHVLLLLRPDISVAKAVQLIKGNSSKWIHDNFPDLKIFSWQEGYGAFSVSISQLEKVKSYIKNQEKHHEKIDFKQEYIQLLKLHNIEYDDKYVF